MIIFCCLGQSLVSFVHIVRAMRYLDARAELPMVNQMTRPDVIADSCVTTSYIFPKYADVVKKPTRARMITLDGLCQSATPFKLSNKNQYMNGADHPSIREAQSWLCQV